MNIVASLESMGLVVRIDDAGALSMIGLQSLSAEERRTSVDLAKEYKTAIVEELRRRSCMDAFTPGGNLPSWVRAHIPGELLDDSRERVCASPRCEAVFMRQAGQPDESWNNKRHCSGLCFSGQPSISLEDMRAVGVLQ